jgi:ketosteroid isomerase-like protein
MSRCKIIWLMAVFAFAFGLALAGEALAGIARPIPPEPYFIQNPLAKLTSMESTAVSNVGAGERGNLITFERHLHQLWHQQNFSLANEILAENYVRHLPGGQEIRGRDVELDNIKQFMTFNWRFVADPVIAKGDYVIARYTGRGTDPATGKPLETTFIVIHRFADGKIVEDWVEYDLLSFFQQQGYQLTPPPKM